MRTVPEELQLVARPTAHDEIVFTPINNDATRRALLSGEADVMEPVPLQDVERIKGAGVNVLQAMSCARSSPRRPQSATSSVQQRQGKNPFRCAARRAFYQAIDEETIVARHAVVPRRPG